VTTGWVRLSRSCNNACVFCLDAHNLDGAEVPLDRIKADLDAVKASGAARVVLSGGEPTMSKHLLAAIRYAKGLGLSTAMTTNGRVIQSEKIAQMLADAGLDEIRISVHSGRRSTHDILAGSQNAWVQGLAGLRFACRTPMRVVMVSVITHPNRAELGHLMHLGTMAGIKGMELRNLQMVSRAAQPPQREELPLGTKGTLTLLSSLWFDAKEEVILLTAEGFDDTIDLGFEPSDARRHQVDRAALGMLRRRVALHHASRGFSTLDEQGMARDLVTLVQEEGDLAEIGLELAARAAPIVDLPPCVGGGAEVQAEPWDGGAQYGADCEGCSQREGCPGAPRKLGKVLGEALQPLPAWRGVGAGARVAVVGGDDALLRGRTLPELVEALQAEGAIASWHPDGVVPPGVDLVVCGDVATAVSLRCEGNPRIEVLDTRLGEGLAGLTREALVRSSWPGQVQRVREAGVSLRRVSWRPYPTPRACQEAGPVAGGASLLALGETADWKLLGAALDAASGTLPPVWILCDEHNPCPDRADAQVVRGADEERTLQAVLAAGAVVLALSPGEGPEQRAKLARDLRWASIAAAAGRPVIAVRGPDVSEQVRHDDSGMLVPPGDVRGLSEAIRRCLHEVNRQQRYQAGARALGEMSSTARWARELVHGVRANDRATAAGSWVAFPVW
jgi:hypothetical protein